MEIQPVVLPPYPVCVTQWVLESMRSSIQFVIDDFLRAGIRCAVARNGARVAVFRELLIDDPEDIIGWPKRVYWVERFGEPDVEKPNPFKLSVEKRGYEIEV